MAFKSAADLEEALRVGTVAPEDLVIEPHPVIESDGVESDMTPEQLQTFVSAEADGAAAEVISIAQDVSSQVTDGEQNPVSTADVLSTERVQDSGVDTAPADKQETA